MLLDSIKKDLKIAMKAKETLKISTLRMITSSIKNIEINNRTSSKDESSNESLSDNEIIQLLTKMIKQRKESAEIYKEKAIELTLKKKKMMKLKSLSNICLVKLMMMRLIS